MVKHKVVKFYSLSEMSVVHKNDYENLEKVLIETGFNLKGKLYLNSSGRVSAELEFECDCEETNPECNTFTDVWTLFGSPIIADYLRKNHELLKSRGTLPPLRVSPNNNRKSGFHISFEYVGGKVFTEDSTAKVLCSN